MTTDAAALDLALDRLIARFGGELAVGSIIRCFADSVRDLRAVGVGAGLASAAESMTSARLRPRLQPAAMS